MEKIYKKVGNKYVEIDQKLTLNQELVLGSAVRYCLGRMSYIVGSMCEELVRLESVLPDNFKMRIVKEIQEYQDEFGKAGMEMDDENWNYVKWLFDKNRRVTIEARHNFGTEICEAVMGADGKYYSLTGKTHYFHTVEKVITPPVVESVHICEGCNMVWYNCLCSHEN